MQVCHFRTHKLISIIDIVNLGGDHVDDKVYLVLGDYIYPYFRANSKAKEIIETDKDNNETPSLLTPDMLEEMQKQVSSSVLY